MFEAGAKRGPDGGVPRVHARPRGDRRAWLLRLATDACADGHAKGRGRMTHIERVWTHFPGKRYAQAEIASHLPLWVPEEHMGLAGQLFARSGVGHRNLVAKPEEVLSIGRSFATKNELYRCEIETISLALSAAVGASVPSSALSTVDLLVTASCTGFQIPAMDALVVRALDLPKGMRRLNLTEHGCAAGAAAIGLAHEWLTAHPRERALIVCAELCSLAFQPEDVAVENLVSAAIFGDGSAAVLLAGPRARPFAEPSSVHVQGTFREIFPDTVHFMGFDLNGAGLKIKLSRDVVEFSRTELPALFGRACRAWGVASPQAFAIGSLHPGGRRILELLEDEVGLSRAVTRTSWDTLAEHGNMSSVTVLAALERLVASPRASVPELGVLSAFGPGFCAELSLIARAPA
jgi:alkylresorcinol/alkylpyrone synthase